MNNLFIISEFPIPPNTIELLSTDFYVEDCELVDARLFSEVEMIEVGKQPNKVVWMGRNVMFTSGYESWAWKGWDFIEHENIIFYDPTVKELFYPLSDFIKHEVFDSWRSIITGWSVGRFGGKHPRFSVEVIDFNDQQFNL